MLFVCEPTNNLEFFSLHSLFFLFPFILFLAISSIMTASFSFSFFPSIWIEVYETDTLHRLQRIYIRFQAMQFCYMDVYFCLVAATKTHTEKTEDAKNQIAYRILFVIHQNSNCCTIISFIYIYVILYLNECGFILSFVFFLFLLLLLLLYLYLLIIHCENICVDRHSFACQCAPLCLWNIQSRVEYI